MNYELIKRGRTSQGIETMYRSSLSLDFTDDLKAIQGRFVEDLIQALDIETTSGLSLHILVDLAEGVYVADIIERDEQRINKLPRNIVC